MSYTQIYRGIVGECVCGCAGTHYYPQDPEFAGMVKKLEKLIASGAEGWDEDDFVVRFTPSQRYQYIGYRKV